MQREQLTTPRVEDLGLATASAASGMMASVLPTGALFALEHVQGDRRVLVNQVLGSPIAGGLGRIVLRAGGARPAIVPLLGGRAKARFGAAPDRIVWETCAGALACRVTLWLAPDSPLWFWRVSVENHGADAVPCDVVFIQDIGLGGRTFLMGNEAYASQYLDHFPAQHARAGAVLMTRQNLAQDDRHPWCAHGCTSGAVAFATDYHDLMGPSHRSADEFALGFGQTLPSRRVQSETACAALQSRPSILEAGGRAEWTFFGAFESDHPEASSTADLAVVERAERAWAAFVETPVPLQPAVESVIAAASPLATEALDPEALRARYGRRIHSERRQGRLLSFFTPDGALNRHVVLADKERLVARRHGAILRSGSELMPTDRLLCATIWMHGVFGAQLTIGNTSFHKLFSISRDPYNITRGSGLRILADGGDGWRLLTVPTAFDMGMSDCRFVYRTSERTIVVTVQVAADDPAIAWRIDVEGPPCRFLVFGQLVLGEHEYAQRGRVSIDPDAKQFEFGPGPDDGLWGQRYPQARYRLVTSTPDCVEAVGADELLYADGQRRSGGFAAIRTLATRSLQFAVVGSLTDPAEAERLASLYARPIDRAAARADAEAVWRAMSRTIRIKDARGPEKAHATIVPWLLHDAMIHLTVPHGLEQYTGAAWGVRDVCQGPLELLLSLERDQAAKSIVTTVFAQQYETAGDWPQWFMLEPYSPIQDRHAHGDVIVWPLKALCDYVEATGEIDVLREEIAWRREDTFEKTERTSPVAEHVDALLATIRSRFIPGTHLIRYGNGDWNDSLQPVDPEKRDWMASSWTVALLYQQVRRYAEILRRGGEPDRAREWDALADAMRDDFNRLLMRDGVLAGYGVFSPEGGAPDLMLHPDDRTTGIAYSLIPMTQAIIGGVFTQEQAEAHIEIIRKQLLFPDGARLMEKPLAYHGGVETTFRRAESAAFFGREIGLMYVHSHLRYAEAMSVAGRSKAFWDALLVVNPIAVTDRLPNASLRQRNAYFSSSDAAFDDRYLASAEWSRVREAAIAVDGGWRVYSSGPGLTLYLLIQHGFGARRRFGERIVAPNEARLEGGLRPQDIPASTSPARRRRSSRRTPG